MKTMLFVLLAFTLNSFSPALADPYDEAAKLGDQPLMIKTGDLFSVKMSPKDRRFTVQAAGNTVGTFDPKQVKVFGRQMRDNKSKHLDVVWRDDHYEIIDPIDPMDNSSTPLEIEVQDVKKKKSEKFKFDLKPKS